MSERWGDSARDRAALDAWITREQPGLDDDDDEAHDDEIEYPCDMCGKPWDEHDFVRVVDEALGVDFERATCPP